MAVAIKATVLSRQMPPWGAVKGFGDFRNDEGLTQEQISVITDWVEGGTPRGNNPNAMPAPPKFDAGPQPALPGNTIAVKADMPLDRAVTLDGLIPGRVAKGASIQIVAALPNGGIEPLLWLYEYRESDRHPFLFRKPLELPAGTVIRSVPTGAELFLIPLPR